MSAVRAQEHKGAVDPGVGSDAPPTLADVRRVVAGYVCHHMPAASGCKIHVEYPGGLADLLAVPLVVDGGDDLESRVLAFLSKLPAGMWMKGRSIAAEMDVELDGGHFRGTMATLVRSGQLESHRTQGYRLARG